MADRATVAVEYLHTDVWAHFTHVTATGARATVAGAIVAGPDLLKVGGRRVLAVVVRTFGDGDADRLLVMPPNATADLVDDPTDHEARAKHALASVYRAGAARVTLLRRPSGDRRGTRAKFEEHIDVDHETLESWANDGDVRLLAVWRRHVPVWSHPAAAALAKTMIGVS